MRARAFGFRTFVTAAVVAGTMALASRGAQAEALLVIEADTGKVLQAENATYPWYPASVTKIMTAYVALRAVKEGRLTLDSLFTVSANAAAQAPSKMGFKPGTTLTLDNALKMMMVKSANDVAVVIAEGVSGSVDNFSAEMNRQAQRIGMTQTTYVNPNGLPAEGQITSARDLGMLARAVFKDLPEYEYFMHVPAIKFGRRVTPNFNKLIGRYPGADGMKTGFICASGFNLVASATRGNKRLIAVVLGAGSGAQRAVRAAQLLERGFGNNKLSWLKPSLGTVDTLAPIDASPPNLRDEMCGPKRKRPAAEDEEDDVEIATGNNDSSVSMFAAGLQPQSIKTTELLAQAAAPAAPVIVYTGPARTGAAIAAADAAETEAQAAKGKGKKGKKLAAKPEGEAKPKPAADKKPDAKESKKDTKTAAKPDAKPLGTSAKPLSSDLKPAAKPDAKPATASATSSNPKPSDAKPAAKPTSGDAKAAAKSGSKPAAEKKPDAAPRS